MPWSGKKTYRFGGYVLVIKPQDCRIYHGYIDQEHPGVLEMSTSNMMLAATHYTDMLAQKITEECREIASARNCDRYTGAPL